MSVLSDTEQQALRDALDDVARSNDYTDPSRPRYPRNNQRFVAALAEVLGRGEDRPL